MCDVLLWNECVRTQSSLPTLPINSVVTESQNEDIDWGGGEGVVLDHSRLGPSIILRGNGWHGIIILLFGDVVVAIDPNDGLSDGNVYDRTVGCVVLMLGLGLANSYYPKSLFSP